MSLAVTGALLDGESVSLRCVDGLIAELGPDVQPQPADQLLDGTGTILVPPLVNGHTHAAMTVFRGFGDDLPLMEWLQTMIWPAEDKLEPEDVYWGTRLAAIEMIRTGTTRFFDMYWDGDQVARAVVDAGLRVTASAVLIDHHDAKRAQGVRDEALEFIEKIGQYGPLVRASFGPHAIYTVSGTTLQWIAERAGELGLPIQIHLSETEREVADCLSANGMRPAPYLDSLGLLGPRTVLAHGVWLDDAELDLIAERGATVVTNPAANMKLAVGGAFPYSRAADRGVAIGLGTDGVSSNSNLDMYEELKLFALLQKHEAHDPSVLPAAAALEIARGRCSELLGGTELKPGQQADFVLLDGSAPELSAGDLDADLVYAANGGVVHSTVVAGRQLMNAGKLNGYDEVLAEVRERARRLTAA